VSVTRAVSVLFLSCVALGIAVSAPARADEGAPHHEATEAGESEAPGSINWFDFSNKEQPPYAALFINFGLLAYGYYRFGKKPVADALKKHKESIAKEIEEAQRMKHEAEGRAKQYQSKLEHVETELAETKNLLEEAGKGEHDRIVKDAEEKAARMQKDAVFMLEQESKQLRLDLQKETVLAALGAAEELLKKRVTGADQERLAEEFLASLEQRSTFSAGTAEKSRS
jgi:F0F1-type ATP synthase membrane subunit b/b'